MKLFNQEINKYLDRLKSAQSDLNSVISSVQEQCEHNHIAECDYQPSEFFNALAPMRVCLECGLSEEGWGCGFKVLKEKIEGLSPRKISRQDLYSIRCGKYISQGD